MPDDQVAFRHMIKRDVYVKFLRDADRRQDVVRAVGVRLERNLLAENRQQRFQLHVERARLGRVLFGLLDLLRVALRLKSVSRSVAATAMRVTGILWPFWP